MTAISYNANQNSRGGLFASLNDLEQTQGVKEERGSAMSSFVLLDRNGLVARKLHFVSLPPDFVIPEGMIVSWRMEIIRFSNDPAAEMFGRKEPVESLFYLGNAQGQVRRTELQDSEQRRRLFCGQYASRMLTVTVQGSSTNDVMRLRDHIVHLIHSGSSLNVIHDLNAKPKQGLLQRLKKMVGR